MPETNELSGVRKSAILVLTLEQTVATEILKHLDENQIEEISREIAGLGPVTQRMRDEVVNEFYQLALARSYADEGGWDYAKNLLGKSLPPEHVEKNHRPGEPDDSERAVRFSAKGGERKFADIYSG